MTDLELYTPNEVAKVLGVSYDTILSLIKKGKLKSIRIGPRLIRIKKSSVEELLNETNFGNDNYLIYKINGSIAHDSNEQMGVGLGSQSGSNNWYKTAYLHQFVEVAANDYIEVYFRHTKGSDCGISGDYSYIMIQYMGGA